MDNEFDKRSFASRLKEIRKSKGLTQEEICEITGIDVSNYSKMETGKIAPSMTSLYKLVFKAGFVPNELFEYEHLVSEEKIDNCIREIYNELSFSEKKCLYKILRSIKEFKN